MCGLLVGAAMAVGCAQPATPPGGEVDRSPPRVIEVVPAAFDTLTDADASVVIRFDERISERLQGVRDWEEAVLVSPATSPHRVKARRRHLEISLTRGWEPDRVYRVMIRPVYRDLFNNQRSEPIDLIFSTGAPIPDGAIAGFVTDRLTGRPVADARVEAVRRIDATAYIALTDTAGFFAMPFMPAGAYDVQAWLDQDRNRERDLFEVQDSVMAVFGVADTAVVELGLLRPDTTPARLARAEPIDSVGVRLFFDDHFSVGPVDGEARVYALPDSTLLGRLPLFHPSRLDSLREADATAQAGEDPAAGADTAEVMVPPAARRGPAASPERPSQELILYAPGILTWDASYFVRVADLTNIQGVAGGGGAAAFVMPPAPTEDEAAPDRVLPGDTLPRDTVPADTVPGDTVPVRAGGDG